MNRQDDLLVPFPTTCRRQDTGGHDLDWHSMVRRQPVQYQNGKRISSVRNRRSRSMIPSQSPVPDVDDVESDNYSHNKMIDDSISSHFNAISVANVVGDDNEFRRLQEDLRNSRTITGTKQVLNQFLESRGRNVEEKRQNHPELNKIKHFHTAPAKPSAGMMIRSFGKRLSQSFGDSKSPQD
jgi:hypothetical protein